MHTLPLQSLEVTDFRRITGAQTLPLNAPVVLIHGPNGSGKTSMLSALEFALTGEIASLQRHNDNYTNHLTNITRHYSEVRVRLSQNRLEDSTGHFRISQGSVNGKPALSSEAARFYSERCYLDQSSLGRLLEIYQRREGKAGTALARFVNELLGLEKLDALREGLDEARDIRRLRKLSISLTNAEHQVGKLKRQLREDLATQASMEAELRAARSVLKAKFRELSSPSLTEIEDSNLIQLVKDYISSHENIRWIVTALRASLDDLHILQGRISELGKSISSHELSMLRSELSKVKESLSKWSRDHLETVERWDREASELGVQTTKDRSRAIASAIFTVDSEIARHEYHVEKLKELDSALAANHDELNLVQREMGLLHEKSTALVEGLSALREVLNDSNVCPVCDRDYKEISTSSLHELVENKLSDFSAQTTRLSNLRKRRHRVRSNIDETSIRRDHLSAMLLSPEAYFEMRTKRANLLALEEQLETLEPLISSEQSLLNQQRDLQQRFAVYEENLSSERAIQEKLVSIAETYECHFPGDTTHLPQYWQYIYDKLSSELEEYITTRDHLRTLKEELSKYESLKIKHAEVSSKIALIEADERKWQARISEVTRRQSVAKEVLKATEETRLQIVQETFTESLNSVWQNVFTRLAPNETFIPRFALPQTNRGNLEISLETVYSDGTLSGPPQVMLSAGNLNTAALSLFMALHLVVEPVIPCLIFDDPVQAMDEVHVSQFAGVIRALAKQHNRQVVIAVHERELFNYLVLELSPAFQGDEMLTIELGPQGATEPTITRHTWQPDHLVAV